MKKVFSKATWMALAGLVAAAAWPACDYDPVIQDAIESLPPEDPAGPSEFHRAGQPCVDCHSAYWGADPQLAIGGTVYEQQSSGILDPVEGVFVTVFDSAGASQKACTNSSGNFFVRLEDWEDAKFPLAVQVGNRYMRSLIGRDRSCAGCHELATQTKVDVDPTVDPSTGQSRTSAGAILVERNTIPVEEQCGLNPASASSSSATTTSSGMGGSGGMMGSGGMGGGGS